MKNQLLSTQTPAFEIFEMLARAQLTSQAIDMDATTTNNDELNEFDWIIENIIL